MNYIEYHEKALDLYTALEEGTKGIEEVLQGITALNEEAKGHNIPITHTPSMDELKLFLTSVTNVSNTSIFSQDAENGFYREDNYVEEDDYSYEEDYSYD